MNDQPYDNRFFASTRGKIVRLLRRSDKTVTDLAAELDLTDNAVRAHLISLERDGLLTQRGTTKGHRKPHNVYGLSDKSRHLFPRPYGTLFNQLLSSLKVMLDRPELISGLRKVGSDLGAAIITDVPPDRAIRIEAALDAVESLGGVAEVTSASDQTVIQSRRGCPFSEAVEAHPEVCQVTEAMLETILDTDVEEACDRSSQPKCRFLVK